MKLIVRNFTLKITCILVLLANIYRVCSASADDQVIKRFISNHVPIENQNWNISQDPASGYIYFANSEGLIEFNGIKSKLYSLPLGQTIRSVYCDGNGIIYTGSFEEFGYFSPGADGNLIYTSLASKAKVEKNDEIWKIYKKGSTICFQSFTTIYCYNGSTVTPVTGPFTMLFTFQVNSGFISQVLEKGLYWFDGSGFKFIEGSELFGWKKIHSIIETADNNYWICTSDDGIYRYDGTGFSFMDSEISSYLKQQTCNAGIKINNSMFLFGTIQNGVVVCDQQGRIVEKIDFTNGLNNNTVLSLFKDRDNGVWIGLDEGVNYFNVYSPGITYTNISGALGTIYTIIHDKGNLYFGTNHGLFRAKVNTVNGDYSFSDIDIIAGTQGQVWTLEQFDDQILCGHNDGTFLLSGSRIRKISSVTGGWSIRKYNDLLIEGTYTGIVFFRKDKNGQWTFRNKIRGFFEPTRHIEVDYLGYIWATHPQKGIYKLELNEALDSVINMKFFNSIARSPRKIEIHKINNRIIFTTADSAYTFSYEKGEIIPLDNLNKTLGEYRTSAQIIPYTKNSYWFINGNHIALFDISKDFEAVKKLELIQKYADIPGRELQILQLSDSNILIPTRQAFMIYNLSRVNTTASPSDLKITKLVFQGARRKNTVIAGTTDEIRIPYNTNNLTAYFANPGQYYIEQKEFRYKLSGIDEEWHTTSLDNFSYLNLRWGSYTLQVSSEFTDSVVKLHFIILKPWYLSLYAFVIYAIIFLLIIYIGIRIFRTELQKQRQLLESELSRSRLESELDYKSYELMLTMRYLIQKNEILNELHEQISTIRENSSKYPVKFINDMEKIISQGLDSQTEEWKNAMNVIKLSQQGYFRKLKDKYPNLTTNDLRLCSYLRMNFATKEIAKLLNISGRAVEISRYRLRRKLGLSHDENLTEFLIKESEGQE